MALVNCKEILKEGRKNGFGVLSLMGGNIEMTLGMIRAAEELNHPLILAFTQEVNVGIPLEIAMPLLVNAAQRAKVPVGTILDHGSDLIMVARAIALGSKSVMFDGSALPVEENIRLTKQVVDYAHPRGVCVEAELGSISGSATDYSASGPQSIYTDPQAAADFVERTGVDYLAISFGNSHGVYAGSPNLDFERVRQIYDAVEVPLVMHGASGLEDNMYPQIVKSGITKVCYYTAMARAAYRDLNKYLVEAGPDTAYHHIITHTMEFFYEDSKRMINLVC
jgi:fructose-bisphosphate aldolase, class II